jgi:hypothetical protein
MKHFVSDYIIEYDDDGWTLQEKKEYYTIDRHTYAYVISKTVRYTLRKGKTGRVTFSHSKRNNWKLLFAYSSFSPVFSFCFLI